MEVMVDWSSRVSVVCDNVLITCRCGSGSCCDEFMLSSPVILLYEILTRFYNDIMLIELRMC